MATQTATQDDASTTRNRLSREDVMGPLKGPLPTTEAALSAHFDEIMAAKSYIESREKGLANTIKNLREDRATMEARKKEALKALGKFA